jgi:hypothetical protein
MFVDLATCCGLDNSRSGDGCAAALSVGREINVGRKISVRAKAGSRCACPRPVQIWDGDAKSMAVGGNTANQIYSLFLAKTAFYGHEQQPIRPQPALARLVLTFDRCRSGWLAG